MKPQEIAENWIAEKGEIRPVNKLMPEKGLCELYTCDFKGCECDKYFDFEEIVKQHTYPCPTLADGEYKGKDLEFVKQYNVLALHAFDKVEWIHTPIEVEDFIELSDLPKRTIVRLKATTTPAIDEVERVEEFLQSYDSIISYYKNLKDRITDEEYKMLPDEVKYVYGRIYKGIPQVNNGFGLGISLTDAQIVAHRMAYLGSFHGDDKIDYNARMSSFIMGVNWHTTHTLKGYVKVEDVVELINKLIYKDADNDLKIGFNQGITTIRENLTTLK